MGDTHGQAHAWSGAGNALERLHRYDEALTAHETAHGLFEQTGDTHGQAIAWNNLGTALRGLCRYDEAVAACRRSAETLESLGDFTRAGDALSELATTLDAAGVAPSTVRETWLRSASAYDTAGAMTKRDNSRAKAAPITNNAIDG
nr:tetratricopeptide repeat protein [Actinospica acidiphila]